jgi:hypothetical protein
MHTQASPLRGRDFPALALRALAISFAPPALSNRRPQLNFV